MHTYSIGWHLSCYHPPMHAYSVGWHLLCYHLPSQPRLLPYFPLVHVACKFVACFFDYTYEWNLCSYYYDFKKNFGCNWNCYVLEYFVLFGWWLRQCWYRYICNSNNIQEQSKMWIVILAADKYFSPPCFISSFELFCLWFPDDHSNEREK